MKKSIYTVAFCFNPAFLALLLFSINGTASAQSAHEDKPKLVIGLVIDQFRWDYLNRFQEVFTTKGFNRLLLQGYNCNNTQIPYLPTLTAPGHTCIYTGSVPALHGIVGNDWYDRVLKRNVNAVEDSSVETVGSSTTTGKASPHFLMARTVSDELRLSNNFRSHVISIALKDRASILPGGHAPNAAYWFDEKSGNWITSSYYTAALPAWVTGFNQRKLPGQYIKKKWELLYPSGAYQQSAPDSSIYESTITSEKRITFPHQVPPSSLIPYDDFRYTPFAATMSFRFAEAAIEHERLGQGKFTDMLMLSISSTDLVGHKFGPNSMEVEDMFARLDRDIAQFLNYLDSTIGQGKYLLFVTADHGVSNIPAYLNENKLTAGRYRQDTLLVNLNRQIADELHLPNAVNKIVNNEIYLNPDYLSADAERITKLLVQKLNSMPNILFAFASGEVNNAAMPEYVKHIVNNSFYNKRSGEIMFIQNPDYFSREEKGTTHGTMYRYDSHILLLWFGWHIPRGTTNRQVFMTDIAPTLAALLGIEMPEACIGKPIAEIVK